MVRDRPEYPGWPTCPPGLWLSGQGLERESSYGAPPGTTFLTPDSLSLQAWGTWPCPTHRGSNVFDILIGSGLPWALQTLAVDYGSYVSGIFPGDLSHWDYVSGQRSVETLALERKQILPGQVFKVRPMRGHSGLESRRSCYKLQERVRW